VVAVRTAIAPAVLLIFAACAGNGSSVKGQLTLDGTALTITRCDAGPAHGFYGVDLVTSGGLRVRLVHLATGVAEAILFDANGKQPIELGACGEITVHHNMHLMLTSGSANLSCAAHGRTLAGRVTYSDCAGDD
jgi:hypothetical protein